jgi:hypothetical protein
MPRNPVQRHQIEQEPVMPKLTDTQTIILSAGAQRPDNIALPLPKGLHGAAAKMAVTKMIAHGWLQEVDANLRRGEPMWRETGDGHGTTLVVTDAGLLAIGIEPVVASTVTNLRNAEPEPDPQPTAAETPTPVTIREGTKQAQIIALLQRPEGAAITEIVAETGWMAHSVRGMISGALKKKLGLPIAAEKVDGRGTVYKLDAA